MAVDIISRIHFLSTPSPFLPLWSFSVSTQISLFNTSDSYFEISARLKLISVPQRLTVVYILLFVTLSREKFPGEYHAKLWDGTYMCKIRFAERSASCNVFPYSRFTWLPITLFHAETERYNTARFSRVTTKFCLGNKVLIRVKSIWQRLFFCCENRVYAGLPTVWGV